MGMMSPVSSATWMNQPGGLSPSCGCCHRTRASVPTMRCELDLHDGLVVHHELVRGPRRAAVRWRAPASRGRPPAWRARTPRPGPCRAPWPSTWRRPRRGAAPQPTSASRRTRRPRCSPTRGGASRRARSPRRRDASMRCATSDATSGSSMPSRRMANSSPPRRAAVSPALQDPVQPVRRPGRADCRRARGRSCR